MTSARAGRWGLGPWTWVVMVGWGGQPSDSVTFVLRAMANLAWWGRGGPGPGAKPGRHGAGQSVGSNSPAWPGSGAGWPGGLGWTVVGGPGTVSQRSRSTARW